MKNNKAKVSYCFYILKCKDRSLYCGVAKDTVARQKLHNAGAGSKYVRSRGGGRIVYSEKYKTLGEALRREAQVKKWAREKKKELIKGQ